MKRIGGLFDLVISRQVLGEAFYRAARGRRQQAAVRHFELNLDLFLSHISLALRDGSYRFGSYMPFRVRDGKSRLIHAPPFEQRVVHHAITLVCGPVFERGAIPFSFACRAGFGHEKAFNHAKKQVNESGWFLHLDVASFYDSISHDLLKSALARRFRERRLLALFDRLIDSYHASPGCGLPMGALTSQWLGNFYLDMVDHWAMDSFGIGRYARYMDDMGAWGEKERLEVFRLGLLNRLSLLGLSAKGGGVLNRCELGMTFLGFTLKPGFVRLHKRGRKRLRSKLSGLHRKFRRGLIGERTLQERGTSLFAWVDKADDFRWRRSVLQQHFDFGDALEPAAGDARRQLRESGRQLPVRLSQQEVAGA